MLLLQLNGTLVIAQEIGDRDGEGESLGNLGLYYDRLGNYKRAIKFQEQSLAIAQEI
ncbi:MAG: tetratricopeptide repeat protein, partial [Cyanobacteria bacterium J06598_3]